MDYFPLSLSIIPLLNKQPNNSAASDLPSFNLLRLGWVSLGFSTTLANADVIRFRMSGSVVELQDAYASGQVVTQDLVNNVVYIQGSRSNTTLWNIDLVRRINTNDSSQDQIIPINTQTNNIIQYGVIVSERDRSGDVM